MLLNSYAIIAFAIDNFK